MNEINKSTSRHMPQPIDDIKTFDGHEFNPYALQQLFNAMLNN